MLPTITTDRLILRLRTATDLDACVAMDSDPEVTRYLPKMWDTPEEHATMLKEWIARSHPAGLGYWSIFPKDNPAEVLGWAHLLPLEGDGTATEIGWRLKRSAWGKGYATEAARAILDHAFGTVGSRRVVAATHSENKRSKRVVERLGFKYVADFLYEGKIPSSSYEITRQ
jgi:RimJ/RimL family protein N-acetyltransferase